MKKVYLLAFSDDFGSREDIKTCIESMPSVEIWRYDMTNAFYLVSEKSANELSNELKSKTKSDGRFVITEFSENLQGWLTEESWYLIKNKTIKPKTPAVGGERK